MGRKVNITVVVNTRNEEDNIADCIASAELLSNKIIVVDMESHDKTVQIVKALQVPIYDFRQSDYVEPAREFTVKKAATDWVLVLDAD